MLLQKRYLWFIVALMCVGTYVDAKRNKRKPCHTKKDCYKKSTCKCYCAEKGDFRKKTDNDEPVYVTDDPNGIYCYCKQWDLDNYPGPVERPKSQKK